MIMYIDNFDFNNWWDMDASDVHYLSDHDTNIEGTSLLEFDTNNISGPDDFFEVDSNDEPFLLSDIEKETDLQLDLSNDAENTLIDSPAPLEFEPVHNSPSFIGRNTLPPNANSDGYIPDGKVTLTSTIGDVPETFKMYAKDGHSYALYNGHYYRIDGSGTVTINGIKYDKI